MNLLDSKRLALFAGGALLLVFSSYVYDWSSHINKPVSSYLIEFVIWITGIILVSYLTLSGKLKTK